MDRDGVVRRIGENVRRTRLEKGMTQHELAHAAGLNITMPGAIENGHHEPRPTTLLKIARALDVKLSELLKGVD